MPRRCACTTPWPKTPSGKQLRVYSGQYLANMRLGKRVAAAQAFGHIVEQGLESKRLGVKFLFKPGSTAYWNDPRASPRPTRSGSMKSAARQQAAELPRGGGAHQPNGPEPMNERLSLRRAEQVRNELLRNARPLAKRVIASGIGSRETMIGNGRDDATDALDRRVEFKVVGC